MSKLDTVLGLVRRYLNEAKAHVPITPGLIATYVDKTLDDPILCTVDRDLVITHIDREFTCTIEIESHSVLAGVGVGDGWLTDEHRAGWRYWKRYEEFLRGKISSNVVTEIDMSTDRILNYISDPAINTSFDKRGMVVGDVQSGKTSHMIGLINKAADAGFNYIVVLTSSDTDLRTQTQGRIDEGVSGRRSACPRHPNRCTCNARGEQIGVGKLGGKFKPNMITSLHEDFKPSNANTSISVGKEPIIGVVKKNSKILTSILGWLRSEADAGVNRESRLADASILIIDDECDYASVDTNRKVSGPEDKNHCPTTINGHIRQLLMSFSKSAYVGYTGTPYANILIHADASNEKDGDDLFPRDFILVLKAPSNYVGATRVFGIAVDDPGLPELIRPIDEGEREGDAPCMAWVPARHRSDFRPSSKIPESLNNALMTFIIGCALRPNEHNTMLIHLTRLENVQGAIKDEIDKATRRISNGLRYGDKDTLEQFEKIWRHDILPTCEEVNRKVMDGLGSTSESRIAELSSDWNAILGSLYQASSNISVKKITGKSDDTLVYLRGQPAHVIAVGGNKLARGLTLEGLTVSYFTRHAGSYDTLLQMGRWFGYRDGYLGLTRLYIPRDAIQHFRDLSEISYELREHLDEMELKGSTPQDFRIRIRKHAELKPTGANKMYDTIVTDGSYSGCISETKIFDPAPEIRAANENAIAELLSKLDLPDNGPGAHVPVTKRFAGRNERTWSHVFLWNQVRVELILDMLAAYSTHGDHVRVRASSLLDYIQRQRDSRNLTMERWNVALFSGDAAASNSRTIAGYKYAPRLRSPDPFYKELEKTDRFLDNRGRFIIKRLVTEDDEFIDADEAAYAIAMERQLEFWQRRGGTGRKPRIPRFEELRRGRKEGLLMIYPIVPSLNGERELWHSQEHQDPFFGIALVFPGERTETSYYRSSAFLDQNSDFDEDEVG